MHGRRGCLETRLFHSEHTVTCCLVHTSWCNVDSSFQNVPEAQPDGVCLEPPPRLCDVPTGSEDRVWTRRPKIGFLSHVVLIRKH